MKIIFSIYTNNLNKHTSVNDYKRSQFEKFKNLIKESQKKYAFLCNADYELFTTNSHEYDSIQFEKLIKLEELTKHYDEVLYLDFDAIPNTNKNFFKVFNLDNICAYGFERKPDITELSKKLTLNKFDLMNVYSKTCCKNAMLLINDINGSDELINTGVIGVSKKSIEKLKFKDRLKECENIFYESIGDNLYPIEISNTWRPNNEVFISYLIEKYSVPYTNIGMQWNFMLDTYCPQFSDAAYIHHHINKEFELSFKND
jgi:hypothetical protein